MGVSHDQTLDSPDLSAREIRPGRVFTARMPLDDAAEAYRAMDERREIKVLLEV